MRTFARLFSPLPASRSSQLLWIMLLLCWGCYYLPSNLRAEPSPPRLGHNVTLSGENQERTSVWLWLCRYTNCQAKQGVKIVSLTRSHDYRSTVITRIPATLTRVPVILPLLSPMSGTPAEPLCHLIQVIRLQILPSSHFPLISHLRNVPLASNNLKDSISLQSVFWMTSGIFSCSTSPGTN